MQDLPTARHNFMGVYEANAWSAPIGCSNNSSVLPLLWLAERCNASLLSFDADVQSDVDICSEPRGEQRRRLSVFHCNSTVWETGLANNAAARFRYIIETYLYLSLVIFYLAGCFSSSQWPPCRCFWWPCRLHLCWPSPLCITESSLKMGVRSFTQTM